VPHGSLFESEGRSLDSDIRAPPFHEITTLRVMYLHVPACQYNLVKD